VKEKWKKKRKRRELGVLCKMRNVKLKKEMEFVGFIYYQRRELRKASGRCMVRVRRWFGQRTPLEGYHQSGKEAQQSEDECGPGSWSFLGIQG
jgi:hypothetical protein